MRKGADRTRAGEDRIRAAERKRGQCGVDVVADGAEPDAEGHPVFVGNPMLSPALDKLFWQVLNKL